MSLMVEAKMAAPLSTSCLQRWTLLQEAAQCSGVLQGVEGEGGAGGSQAHLSLSAPSFCVVSMGVTSTNELS